MSTNTINTLNDSTDGSGIAGRRRYVRAGVTAGAVAAVVNTVIAALADAADVSFAVPGDGEETIPLVGFAQLTFFAALIGVAIAAIVNRRSQRPALIFTEITVALTAVSFIPSLVVDAEPATKAVLVITHVVAAAIVIPTIAKQLAR